MDCSAGAALARGFGGMQVGGVQMPHIHDGDAMGDMQHLEHGPAEWAGEFGHMPLDAHPMHRDHMAMMELHQGSGPEVWADQFEQMTIQPGAAAPIVNEEMTFEAAFEENDWATQFQKGHNEEEWAQEFNNDDVVTLGIDGEAIRTVEEKIADSHFYNFMNKVNTGELIIDDVNGVIEGTKPAVDKDAEWADELVRAQEQVDVMMAQGGEIEGGWAAQMEEHEGMEEAWGEAEGEESGDPYGQEFIDGDFNSEKWAEEYQEMIGNFDRSQMSSDYPFDPDNPYLFHDNPFEEGMDLRTAGALSEAVLAFEAACQKQPDRQEAWRLLGTSQAENEKDLLAIRALNKARELDPKDSTVHLALAVSHANETNHSQALQSLRGWLLSRPEYEQLGNVVLPDEHPPVEGMDDFANEYLFETPKELSNVCTLFDAAIEMNPADHELYVGLGIVNHLSHDYDAAAENFRKALEIRPDDPKLWNKMGATLANGTRSREALEAYDRALDLNPGYVRAQYNMGIAHNNLGEHMLAAKDFIRAIVMQQGGVGGGGDPADGGAPTSRSTREMWDVLRMALNLMNRSDLVDLSWKQDVVPFLGEFDLTSLQ